MKEPTDPNRLSSLSSGDTILARIETESPCKRCAYVLRTQAVRRDVATGLLVVRCPECGIFHSTAELLERNTAWRRWLGRGSAGRWSGLLLWLLVIIGLCQLGHRLAAVHSPIEARWRLAALGSVFASLAAAMLACSAYMYRLSLPFRATILLASPVLTVLIPMLAGAGSPDSVLLTCPIQCMSAVVVAWLCRRVLRVLVRICCANNARGPFRGLWAADGKSMDLSPW